MKDFADIPNKVGTFPNVTAVDCTGPGETDGTAVIADTMTDYFGAMQALLNAVGDTPSGSAETATVSQILTAMQLIPAVSVIPAEYGVWSGTGWAPGGGWPYDVWSNANSAIIYFSVLLPSTPLSLTIDIEVLTGAARAGTNRTNAKLMTFAPGAGVPTNEIPVVYSSTSAALQTITLSKSFTPVAGNRYVLEIQAGNDGATNRDIVYIIKVTKNAS
jgi:hypothetical protein